MIYEWILLGLRILAPFLLYLFLGITFHQMWIAHREKEELRALLRQLDNPETVWLLSEQTSVGRDANNTIVLEDEFVSAYHATLTYKEGVWWLTDLNSTNGTRVNDKLIDSPTPLNYGDIISLGDIQYRLERGG
jgi:hypothetical protein